MKQGLSFPLRDTNLRMICVRQELSVGPEERKPGENLNTEGRCRGRDPTGTLECLSVFHPLAPGPLCTPPSQCGHLGQLDYFQACGGNWRTQPLTGLPSTQAWYFSSSLATLCYQDHCTRNSLLSESQLRRIMQIPSAPGLPNFPRRSPFFLPHLHPYPTQPSIHTHASFPTIPLPLSSGPLGFCCVLLALSRCPLV